MMTYIVASSFDGSHLATLGMRNGKPAILFLADDVRMGEDIQKWIDYGLSEWVGEPGRRRPQRTTSDQPEFLRRVAQCIESYNFLVFGVEESDEQD